MKKVSGIMQLEPKEVVSDENLEIDLLYITHQQVGRKRNNLFNKKVQFQN